jgi:regulator of replication initiation timing
VRLWGKGGLFDYPEDQLEFLGNRRLDGRETQLRGYWKFAEGQGSQLADSSRFRNHGILTGGEWLRPSQSSLQLDCGFELIRWRREEIRQRCEAMQKLKMEEASLPQQIEAIERRIQWLVAEQKNIDTRIIEAEVERNRQLQLENDNFKAWEKQIKDGGKVGLDHFSTSVAKEVQDASEEFAKKKRPYLLHSVGLEVKMLPVQKEGEADFMVIFPQPEDPTVQPGQLSTLALSFEPRLQEPEKKKEVVPDVRGYTEVLARRILSGKGFRVEMLDQAVDKEELIDRVIDQVPEPDPKKPFELNGTVTMLLGRASGGA